MANHQAHIEVVYDNGYECHQVIPECDAPDEVLSANEIVVLDRICEKFDGFGSVEISKYSHKEAGYQATNPMRLFHIHLPRIFTWIKMLIRNSKNLFFHDED